MEVFVEALVEVVIELLAMLFADATAGGMARVLGLRSRHRGALFCGCLFWGIVCGSLSVWLQPEWVLRSFPLRLLATIALPMANGWFLGWLGRRHTAAGKPVYLATFANGVAFALPMSLLRLCFGR